MYTRLPPILRPRWTWKYVLGSAAVAYVAYCWLFAMPLFAHNLPRYTGRYPVGAIDIEVPLEKPRIVHDAKFLETGEDAFKVETVLFTLYYPATRAKSARSKHYWVPRPLSLTAEGYARFAHVSNYVTHTIFTGAMGLLVGSLTIPAKVDVPLAGTAPSTVKNKIGDSETSIPGDEDGFPVIVFSHGMASSRTDYTHYIGELASRGYVVAAIEHRDGSSPGTFICHKNGPPKPILHFDLKDVVSKLDMDVPVFKQAQLDFRQAEIEEAVQVIKRINMGDGHEVFTSNSRYEGVDLASWRGRLNTNKMTVAGHSYGATGALQALRYGPSSSNLPFHSAIILDPGKQSGPLNADIAVPLLVIHSDSWSATRSIFQGRPHFEVVRDIVRSVNERGKGPAWFMTSLGTSHPSVTDAPLIEPLLLSWTTGSNIDVQEAVRQYVHVSDDFLKFNMDGKKRHLLAEPAEYPEYDEHAGYGKEKHGYKRFWQIHVAPEHAR